MSKRTQEEIRRVISARWRFSSVHYAGRPYYAVNVEGCEFQVWKTPEGLGVIVRDCGPRMFVGTAEEIPDVMPTVARRARAEVVKRLDRNTSRLVLADLPLYEARDSLRRTLRSIDDALAVMDTP